MKYAGAIAGLILAVATQTEAAEIKVLSTGGARAVMTSLVPEFERKSGHKVILDFGTPGNMRDRLIQGEAADVAVAIAAVCRISKRPARSRLAPAWSLPRAMSAS